MNLVHILVTLLVMLGAWPLVFTGRFLNTRATEPTIIYYARALFVVVVVLLLLTFIGTIPNKL